MVSQYKFNIRREEAVAVSPQSITIFLHNEVIEQTAELLRFIWVNLSSCCRLLPCNPATWNPHKHFSRPSTLDLLFPFLDNILYYYLLPWLSGMEYRTNSTLTLQYKCDILIFHIRKGRNGCRSLPFSSYPDSNPLFRYAGHIWWVRYILPLPYAPLTIVCIAAIILSIQPTISCLLQCWWNWPNKMSLWL